MEVSRLFSFVAKEGLLKKKSLKRDKLWVIITYGLPFLMFMVYVCKLTSSKLKQKFVDPAAGKANGD